MIEGQGEAEIDRRADAESMTLREVVHHIVEANVVAASIITAALGSPGSVYDWSWMLPFGKWMERMRYDKKPLAPSLRLLEALNEYVAAQIEPLEDGLERRVRLRDEPDGLLREVTVADILLQEAAHAREHFEEARGRG
jgi:Lon protease-like protein